MNILLTTKLSKLKLTVFLVILSPLIRADERLLKTYVQSDAPPRYIYSEKGSGGVCMDIINEINRRLNGNGNANIEVENKSVPIKRILDYLVSERKISVFVGSAKTEERKNLNLQFSSPLYPIQTSFAKRSGDEFQYLDDSSLDGKIISVLRGSRSDTLVNRFGKSTIVRANSIEQSLHMLSAGRVDLVYYHDLGLAWQIRDLGLVDQISLVGDHISFNDASEHFILYSKSVPKDIVARIDVEINKMKADGTIDSILKKYR